MRTDLLSFLQQRSDVKLNRKVVVFIICLVISALSWVQINLSKEQVSTVSVVIDFVNLPKTRFGVASVSDTLQMEVEANGYALLKYKMKEVQVDFKKLKKDVNTGSFYFLPNNYVKAISKQMGDNLKLLRAVVDTIQLNPRLR